MAAKVVLYVEDDDAVFHLAKIALEREDPPIQLLRACDGEQAFAILRNMDPYQNAPQPDLILLDLNLPKKNGLEILADLKANESFCSIPVVMFTTSLSRTEKRSSQLLGAQDYVAKPSTLDSFAEAVKKACSYR